MSAPNYISNDFLGLNIQPIDNGDEVVDSSVMNLPSQYNGGHMQSRSDLGHQYQNIPRVYVPSSAAIQPSHPNYNQSQSLNMSLNQSYDESNVSSPSGSSTQIPSPSIGYNRMYSAPTPSTTSNRGRKSGKHGVSMAHSTAASSTTGVCSVCGDSASGHHYGVFSCEACKAFFKRTVQGNIEYTCPSEDNCEISKNRRKACQACRFKKCLLVGMMKEGVRPDRVRGGRQKYQANPVRSLLDPTLTSSNVPSEVQGMRANIIRKLIEVEPVPVNLNFQFSSQPLNEFASSEFTPNGQFDAGSLEQAKFLALVSDQSLVETIAWCKHVPGFLELTSDDQLSLIYNSWADILILNVAFKSVSQLQDDEPSQNFSSVTFAADTSLDSELLRDKAHLLKFVEFSLTTIYRVHQAKLCAEEKALLKAMTLCCPDALRLGAAGDVEKMQDQLHDALRDFVSSRYPSDRNRLYRLVLILPIARMAACKFIELMQKIVSSGVLKGNDQHGLDGPSPEYLFPEMLPVVN